MFKVEILSLTILNLNDLILLIKNAFVLTLVNLLFVKIDCEIVK